MMKFEVPFRVKRRAATYLSAVGYGLFFYSVIHGLTDIPNSYLVRASESEAVFWAYSIAMGLASLAGAISALTYSRLAESYAAVVVAGLLGLHGSAILYYTSPFVESCTPEFVAIDFLGWRMLGGACLIAVYAFYVRYSTRAAQMLRASIAEAGEGD